MAQQKVQLRKLRDFGENFSDTFQFIRQELKPLLRCFLALAGVFIILTGITSGFYQTHSMNWFTSFLQNERSGNIGNLGDIFNGAYFLLLFFSLLNSVVIQVTIASYMKVYDSKGGVSPTLEETWKEFRKHVIPVFFYSLVIVIMCCIGFVLCILPGIYLGVILAPAISIYVIEDVSFGKGISRCFTIVKNNFWISLAIYIVAYLIYSFSSTIVGLIIGAITGVISYFTTKDLVATLAWVTGALSILQHVFYIILFISINLHYFNLAEQKDGEGLLRRLNNMGNDPVAPSPQEEY